MNPEIPQDTGIENKEQPEQNNFEVPQSVDETQAEITQEIESTTADFEKENENISKIETSVELDDPQEIKVIKDELKVDESIEELDTQARILKHETEKQIEWVQLDNHEWDENNFYRIVDKKGYADYLENEMVRSSSEGTKSKLVEGTNINIGGRKTQFPSFAKSEPDWTYEKEGEDNYILESPTPMYRSGDTNPVTGNVIGGVHWAYRPIDSTTGKAKIQLSSKEINNVYKKDVQGNLLKQQTQRKKN